MSTGAGVWGVVGIRHSECGIVNGVASMAFRGFVMGGFCHLHCLLLPRLDLIVV